MNTHATGQFNVTLAQQPSAPGIEAAQLGRQTIDKQFHGDLEAHSLGEMLAVMTAVSGSAAYVALERVEGVLHGRTGSFVLQHRATMTRGEPALSVQVVPDSATGELAGLRGEMRIEIRDRQHFYHFDYTLPDADEAPDAST